MPALPPVPQVLQVNFVHTVGEDPNCQVRVHMKYTGAAPAVADLNNMASIAATSWNTSLAPLAPASVKLTSVRIIDLSSASGAVGVWTGTHAGTSIGSPLSAGSATLINYAITRRYRGGKPRSYWPIGTTAVMNDQQTWTAAYVSNAGAAVLAVFGQMGTATWTGGSATQGCSVSYYQGFTPFLTPSGRYKNISKVRTTPLVDNVLAVTANSRIGSQRRRIRGTGN